MMKSFNALVREGKKDGHVGHYRLVYCNDCGQMLVHFFAKEDSYISLIGGLLRTEDVDTRGQSLETQEGIR